MATLLVSAPTICLAAPLPMGIDELIGIYSPEGLSSPHLNSELETSAFWEAEVRLVLNKIFPNANLQPAVRECSKRAGHRSILRGYFPDPTGDTYLNEKRAIEMVLVSDRTPLAYASPNDETIGAASVVISSGLLKLLSSRSELAFVLAHEFAHIKSNHFSPQFSALLFTPPQLAHIAAVHRKWELEADSIALDWLEESDFDHRAPIGLLERLDTLAKPLTSDLLHHHPSIQKRMSHLRGHLAQQLSALPNSGTPNTTPQLKQLEDTQ